MNGDLIRVLLGLIAGYFFGSIPASFGIARYGFGVDLRTIGSGNVGATNALRALGPRAGLPALLCDSLKGTFAVLFSGWLLPGGGPFGSTLAFQLACGLAAVLGHTFTIFLMFRGGKGVATGAGVFAALAPVPLALSLCVFLLVVASTRYVSAGSILAALSLPVFLALMTTEGRTPLVAMAVSLAIFITWRHRDNLKRLAAGTESRITFGRPSSDGTPTV